MPIFHVQNQKAKQVYSDLDYFKNEAKLRDFFADNLEALLGLRFLEKEYPTDDGRMDTIAIDETNSPVIIEYKWGKDDAIFTQGLFYFNWLKNNKKHFNLLVEHRLGKDTKVNWDRPRVILLAHGFDKRTKVAVQQVNYVELIRYVTYKEDILYLETVYSPNSYKKVTVTSKKTGESIKDYDINYHLGRVDELVKKAFYSLQEKIKLLPGVEEVVNQKTGITYRTTKSFVRFEFGKSYMKVLVRESKYQDSNGLVKDITTHMWGYKGLIKIKSVDMVEDVFEIIKQSYEETI
jgi:predicted transport protein